MRRAAGVLSIVCIAGLLASAAGAGRTNDFDRYFTGEVLRVDIIHSGTHAIDEVAVRSITKEPMWPGSRVNVVESWERGMYRLDVTHARSGELIYRRGFSTLFGEWKTTDEARVTERAFEETLEVPFPRDSIELSIFLRGDAGAMALVFSTTIDPAGQTIETPSGPGDASGAEVVVLEVNGEPQTSVDLLVLGDGYTRQEKAKFKGDCSRFVNNLFSAAPFDRMRHRFNVRAVLLPSNDSGIDEPRKGMFSDTPFGTTFNMFDVARYCMTEEVWAIHDAAARVPHDVIVVMANTSRYGGGAIFNYYTVVVSDNEYDDYLTLHEFGHGFAGLADEYYAIAIAYNDFYPRGVEPTEPNITALLDPENLKWKAFVDDGTPIPTPADDENLDGTIGAFEGAGYAAKDLYRPAKDCRMFSKGNRAFCKVCESAIVDMIRWYAPD